MDFRFTDEQAAIQETIRDFMAKECPREVARDLDARQAFPSDLLKRIAALGFCGLTVPDEFGGAGNNLLGAAIIITEIAALSPTLAGAFAAVALRGGSTIANLGSDAQKKRFLPAIGQGKMLFTYALDDMTARADGEELILSGECKSVALAGQADYIITRAGDSCFVVNVRADGLRAREIRQVGFRGAQRYEVTFDGVRLARADMLHGEEQLRTICESRQIENAALCLGIAQGAYDYAANYARERFQFGKPIADFEAIQHMLVDIAVDLRASRLLLYQACSLADQGAPYTLDAAIAELHAVEIERRAALQGLHILGGYGYMMEYDAQRYVRDALSLLEGCDSTAVLKSTVGAMLGLTTE